jgi:hypothetical protein
LDAVFAQRLHPGVEVGNLQGDAVPASRLGLGAIRHRRAAAARPARSAQQQAEVPLLEDREGGSGVHHLLELEVLTVEGDRLVDVADDVADGGHLAFLLVPAIFPRGVPLPSSSSD